MPLQYPSLSASSPLLLRFASLTDIKTELGYSSQAPTLSLDERKKLGATVENILKHEKEAAKAPQD